MSPEMLTAMLSDPRAQPAQRMAAMNMLNQMKGGGGSPMAAPMAAPQGDGTGAGDMDPSFIRAVQREMQGEQAPQGLPPVQGQQMAQAPQDQGVQGDIAAGVDFANRHFAQGGAVRGYQVGGKVGDAARNERLRRLAKITGITDEAVLEAKMAELEANEKPAFPSDENPGFLSRALASLGPLSRVGGLEASYKPQSVENQITQLEAEPIREQQAIAAKEARLRPYRMAIAGQRPVNVINPDELDFQGQPVKQAEPDVVVKKAAADQRPIQRKTVEQLAVEKPSAPAPDAAGDTSQKPVDDGGYAERMKKLLDDDEGDMTPRERSMALIQAGAAMMAAASKPGATFLGSAGEGLTKGLEGFNETRSNRAVKRMKQAAMLQAERQAGIENTRGNKLLAVQEETAKLARDQYNTNKDPNSPENKYRSAATKALTKPSNFAERNAESKRISALPPGPEKDAATNAFNMATGIINQQTLTSRQNAKLVEVSLKAGAAFDKSLDAMTGTPAEIKAKRNAAVMAAVQEAKGLLGLSDDTGNGDIDSEDSLPE